MSLSNEGGRLVRCGGIAGWSEVGWENGWGARLAQIRDSGITYVEIYSFLLKYGRKIKFLILGNANRELEWIFSLGIGNFNIKPNAGRGILYVEDYIV